MASGSADAVMGAHETWFHLIPGARNLENTITAAMGEGYLYRASDGGMGFERASNISHLFTGVFVFGLLVFLALRYKAALGKSGDDGVIPDRKFNLRTFVDVIGEATLGTMTGMMGEKAAKRFFPLIATMAFFILFSNFIGLVPGFLPPTDALQTTAACAIIVFIATHVYGLQANGMGHIKHMMGPVWWLAPLMLVIEIIGHLARPLSLSLRLMGNMIGDHQVLALFVAMTYIFVPIPFFVLGIIVCTVQTLVFCMLSAVYIALAIEDQHHDDHAHAH